MRMADLALERVKPDDVQRRSELERIKADAMQNQNQKLAEARARRCFFSMIPVEICSEVFLLVSEKSNSKMLALTAVCKRWRDIIIDTPMLWRRLTLTPSSTATKVETWFRRARGTVHTLDLRKGFSFHSCPGALRNAFRDGKVWERLDTLRYQVPDHACISDPFPSGTFERLNLRELELSFSSSHPSTSWQPLDSLRLSPIETVHISSAPALPWSDLQLFTNLRALTLIDCQFSFQEVYQVLTQRPQLEKLILMHTSSVTTSLEGPLQDVQPLDLPRLTHFEISTTNGDMSHFFSHLSFPNIETLSISCALRNTRYLDALEKSSTVTQLTELAFRRCLISQRSLSNLLRKANKLERLVYSECVGDSADSVIYALSGTQCKSDASVSNPTIIPCPSLHFLDVSGCQDLQAGPLVQLVKAHLASRQTKDKGSGVETSTEIVGLGEVSPIRTLHLTNCMAVDPEVLPWLRSKVEIVQYSMTVRGKLRRTHIWSA